MEGNEREKKERGPPGKEEMRWRRSGEVVVDGHVEWHMWDQRSWSEERERSSGVAQATAAKVQPSKVGSMWDRIMSEGRREKEEVEVEEEEEDMIFVC